MNIYSLIKLIIFLDYVFSRLFYKELSFEGKKTRKMFHRHPKCYKTSSERKKYKHYRIYDVEKDKKMKNVDKIFKISDWLCIIIGNTMTISFNWEDIT